MIKMTDLQPIWQLYTQPQIRVTKEGLTRNQTNYLSFSQFSWQIITSLLRICFPGALIHIDNIKKNLTKIQNN